MNRREFFKRMSAVAAVGTVGIIAGQELDLDKLLWVPGERTFFLPPEKRLITDQAAIQQEYESLRPAEDALKTGAFHEVHTAVGWVKSDAHWNVISVAGKKVSAWEAARYRLGYFSRFGMLGGKVTNEQVAKMTQQILGERQAAGWSFAEATAGLPSAWGAPLISIDGFSRTKGAPNYGWPDPGPKHAAFEAYPSYRIRNRHDRV